MSDFPVVAAVDGSEHSHRALEWALGEAHRLGAELRVVHVSPEELQVGLARIHSLGQDPEIVDAVLEGAKRQVEAYADGGVRAQYATLDGSVSDALVAEAGRARVLVVGSRGRGGFASLLLGSTSRSLTSSAPCPVVVVPHEARAAALTERPEAGRVLLGLHPEETADAVVAFAFEEARGRSVALEVVTAYPVPPSPLLMVGPPAPVVPLTDVPEPDRPEFEQEADEHQAARLGPFTERYHDVKVVRVVAPMDAAGRLVEDSATAALVVVGRHHRRLRPGSLTMGSVAHAVLQHAQCPVAVVPAAPEEHAAG
ncbi:MULTISPECIES: universal stress protein [Streptomyces]|uniref:Universal stress protein n=1 Tax=Streptomyces solicathayae TaxID=3081768 RepID=A0ABZ0M2V6_9ACTN|nr:universal stress protein [Streptomyces sp. HUAS YS2]WOX26108.1 universal stress protein [Streptomyces sp. HUAS YS2]